MLVVVSDSILISMFLRLYTYELAGPRTAIGRAPDS